jgi:hypothetical protein
MDDVDAFLSTAMPQLKEEVGALHGGHVRADDVVGAPGIGNPVRCGANRAWME